MTQTAQKTATPLSTGEDFQESPLFYGRWNAEEEKYAEALIEEFRDGNLEEADFEGGPSTLRGFLATKLRCAPKRISKKFESSGYNGRMQYVRKQGTMTPEESEERRQKLETLREGFETRRSGLPKKPIKKKRSLMSSTSRRSTGGNSLARDAAIVAADSAFHSPVMTSAIAEASLPGLTLGSSGNNFLGAVMNRDLLFGRALGAGLAPASLLSSQRTLGTDSILGRSRVPGFAASALAPSLFAAAGAPAPVSDAALLSSLLGTNPGGAGLPLASGSDLLLAEAAKRRMNSARLYSILHRENTTQASLLLHEQISQRKRLEEALAAAESASTSIAQEAALEGPPSKRPRAA